MTGANAGADLGARPERQWDVALSSSRRRSQDSHYPSQTAKLQVSGMLECQTPVTSV